MSQRTNSTLRKKTRQIFLDSLEDYTWALCGKPVDMTLSGNASMGPTVDHIVPVAVDPDLEFVLTNLQLSHSLCNKRKYTKSAAAPIEGRYMKWAGQSVWLRWSDIINAYHWHGGVPYSDTSDHYVTFDDTGEIMSAVPHYGKRE